jgi:DNA-binding transcriptional ArsR family regulator
MVMNRKQKILENRSLIFKALGQPTRLRILELLRGGERCVCEIFPAIGQEQANVSKHLSILKQAGILECRKDGLRILYRIKNPEVLQLLNTATRILKANVQEQQKIITGL